MRYVRTTKIEHSLELNGDELQDFLRGDLHPGVDSTIGPPDSEPLAITVLIPDGAAGSHLLDIKELWFFVSWGEEEEFEG